MDVTPERQLLSAIVAKAITDATMPPPPNTPIHPYARSALEYLFSNDVDLYLELLDIDPEAFKERITKTFWSDSEFLPESQKRTFQSNYKRWQQEKNAALLFYAGKKR